MRRETRRIIFWLLVLLFAAATPAIIGYSIGYRFDWETNKIVVTGSLFIKAKPSQTRIFLNEKFKKETSLIWSSALISNLKPKNYDIRIEKDGFWPWRKNLSVKPELVTEARNIILFPKEPVIEKAAESGIAQFWPSPDNSKIIYLAETENEKPAAEPNLKIRGLKTGAEIDLEQTAGICQKTAPLRPEDAETDCRIIWAENGEKILIHRTKEPERWRLIEINWQNGTAMNFPIFQKPYKTGNKKFETLPVSEAMFDPENSDIIFYSLSGRIYSLDIESGLVSRFSSEEILAFAVSEDSIFYLSENAEAAAGERETADSKYPEFYAYQASKNGKQKIKLNSEPLNLGLENKTAAEFLISPNGKIALRNSRTLYYFNPKTEIFSEITENAKNAAFSPDEKKLLYSDENDIGVYYLEEILIQPYRKTGDLSELARLAGKIGSALWRADGEHIIFWGGGIVKIAELDDRGGINIIDFWPAENPLIFYDGNASELYFLDKQALFKTEI